mgnify:CR=1 FL=1
MRVLAIGLDDVTVAFLRSSGIAIEMANISDVDELKDWLVAGAYDAGVVDLDACSFGAYAARGLRTAKKSTTFIGISKGAGERKWSDQRALFLENGDDDLLHGPVNPRELVASLRAATRRFSGSLVDIYEAQAGGALLKINLTTKSVVVNGGTIQLSGKEEAMVLLFASSPGRVLSKEVLLTQLYTGGVDDEPEMKIIDVFICKVRRKLEDCHPDAVRFIETVWGRGYRMPTPAEFAAQDKKVA